MILFLPITLITQQHNFHTLEKKIMKKFLRKNGIPFDTYTVRTKLNNERKKHLERSNQRKEQMNLLKWVLDLF